MRLLIPLMNTLNFLAIFLILYLTGTVNSTTLIIGIVTGLIIGLIIELVFHHSKKPRRRKRALPEKVSTKLIILPSALLLVLVVLAGLYATGHNPFEFAGHATTDETTEEVNETVEEEPVEEEEPEPEYVGHCEERELKKEFNQEAGAFAHIEDWERVGYKCNVLDDCIDKLDDSGRSYDPDDIRCDII
jgi:hypothetical protein